jgi:hypothetical protein
MKDYRFYTLSVYVSFETYLVALLGIWLGLGLGYQTLIWFIHTNSFLGEDLALALVSGAGWRIRFNSLLPFEQV